MQYEEILEKQVELMNSNIGDLTEVDCPICKNKGYVYFVKDTEFGKERYVKDCSCLKERKIIRNLKLSGLYEDFKTKTLDSFIAKNSWQKVMKDKAIDFINDDSAWLTILGQSGAGKTHICTAVSKELIEQGKGFMYLPFTRDMPSIIHDSKSYHLETKETALDLFNNYKKVEVLYIDDFLKTNNKEMVFELIDYRYKNNLKTIISSELSMDEILLLDEAIGGRLKEKSKNYLINITKDKNRNYRLGA